MRLVAALFLAFSPALAMADPRTDAVRTVVEEQILPGFDALNLAAQQLAQAAANDCTADAPGLTAAWGDAFDAWIAVSHFRFGPTETGDRAFSLAYWPDPRGFTPDALRALILAADPAVNDPAAFSAASIAARGFYAMEFLLYDEDFRNLETDTYRCALIRAQATDIAATTAAIAADWQGNHASLLLEPGNPTYTTSLEAAQSLYTALLAGLEFDIDTRLGRPMGTFDAPRPTRAEVWRSGRSQRHLVLSIMALADLAHALAPDGTQVRADLDQAFGATLALVSQFNDPAFADVADPQGRFRLQALQSNLGIIRDIVGGELGPALGVAIGFNAGDGD